MNPQNSPSDAASLRPHALVPSGGTAMGLPATRHPDALVLQRQYPDSATLLTMYNPDVTDRVMAIRDRRRIYFGKAPALNVVREAYGPRLALSWIEIQLANLSEYAGVRDKMPPAVIHDLASIILAKYWYLRLSEFMLFICEFKAGTFGRFYGTVDPMVIADALRRFDALRQQEMDRIVREDRQRAFIAEREASAAKACTYREWLARKEILGYIMASLLTRKDL